MKKSLYALISVLLCFAVLLASCQDDSETSKNNTTNPSDNSYSDFVENNSEGAIIDNIVIERNLCLKPNNLHVDKFTDKESYFCFVAIVGLCYVV